jgi:uncharacterized membrane protein
MPEHQQQSTSPVRQGPHDLHAELARLARDETAEVKAGLARLALEEVPEGLHALARLRNYFLAGLVIVGPVAITLYIAGHVITMVDGWVKAHIPLAYNPNSHLPVGVPGFGLVCAVVGLTLVGALAANLLGRSLISMGELMVGRMPIVRNVYQALKQIFASVVSAANANERILKVALVQFPSRGIWSLGFVTGDAAGALQTALDGDLVSVFITHGLLPPSGFTCFFARKDVIPISMSVEDAARIVLSAGMANPRPHQPDAHGVQQRRGPVGRATEPPAT